MEREIKLMMDSLEEKKKELGFQDECDFSNFEDNIDSFCEMTDWIPEKRDIKWTKERYKEKENSNKKIKHITSDYTLVIDVKNKMAKVVEMNMVGANPNSAYENLGRIAKCLKKLGWKMALGDVTLNAEQLNEFRMIPGVGNIKSNTIKTSNYNEFY